MMKLGVVITDDAHGEVAIDLLQAAAEQNHELRCFLTDTGVHAVAEAGMQKLLKGDRLQLSVCEHSMERFAQEVPEEVSERVVVGGQYQDAELAHWCDRVVVY